METANNSEVQSHDHLVEALLALKAEMRKNRTLIETATRDLEKQSALVRELEIMVRDRSQQKTSKKGRSKTPLYSLVTEKARAFMIEAGHPLTRHDVLERLNAEGHALEVSDPPHFVGKTLWKSPDFVSYKEGYWPLDMPVPNGATPTGRNQAQKTAR